MHRKALDLEDVLTDVLYTLKALGVASEEELELLWCDIPLCLILRDSLYWENVNLDEFLNRG